MTESTQELDTRNVIHRFFFPLRNQKQHHKISNENDQRTKDKRKVSPRWRFTHSRIANVDGDDESITPSPKSLDGSECSVKSDSDLPSTTKADRVFVNTLWTTYDDLLILSIFTQVGIVFRLAVSTYFTFFDAVFSNDSALFVNLPLNCFSCFIMGLLCSGERLMEVIATRFSPLDLQAKIQQDESKKSLTYAEAQKSPLEEKDDFESGLDATDFDQESMAIGTSTVVDDVPSSRDDGLKARTLFRSRGGQRRGVATTSKYNGLTYRRRNRRRLKRQNEQQWSQPPKSWEPPLKLYNELRDVQLLALERRIRMSKCLVLFPAEQEEVDVMEHYFQTGYRKNDIDEDNEADESDLDVKLGDKLDSDARNNWKKSPGSQEATRDFRTFGDDLELVESYDPAEDEIIENEQSLTPSSAGGSCDSGEATLKATNTPDMETSAVCNDNTVSPTSNEGQCSEPVVERVSSSISLSSLTIPGGADDVSSDGETTAETAEETVNHTAPSTAAVGVDQMISDVTTNVTENISRLRRVNVLEGWDAGTTPTAMSDDLLLGLRAGFCGALSSFSSWNSAMGGLILQGRFGEAIIGYILGLQLPIVSYRFGQNVAVYIFVWRARRQTRRAERRGYGLKLSQNDDVDAIDTEVDGISRDKKETEIPSVRAFVTVIFIIALITQCVSLFFYKDPLEQQLAMSLLFSPLGVLARWRLTKLNRWRPNFALGTFTSNILACALGGSLGTLLSGNAGPKERIILVSVISGFAGTLSSVGAFIEEILAGLDPILLRLDGLVYAVISIVSAMVVVLIFSTSADWADTVRDASIPAANETVTILNNTDSNFRWL